MSLHRGSTETSIKSQLGRAIALFTPFAVLLTLNSCGTSSSGASESGSAGGSNGGTAGSSGGTAGSSQCTGIPESDFVDFNDASVDSGSDGAFSVTLVGLATQSRDLMAGAAVLCPGGMVSLNTTEGASMVSGISGYVGLSGATLTFPGDQPGTFACNTPLTSLYISFDSVMGPSVAALSCTISVTNYGQVGDTISGTFTGTLVNADGDVTGSFTVIRAADQTR